MLSMSDLCSAYIQGTFDSSKLFLIYESLDLLDVVLLLTKDLVLVENTCCLLIIHSFSYEIANREDPVMVSWI